MQTYNKTEKIIISAAILIFLLSGTLMFFGGLDKIQEFASGRESIGTIVESQNDVRHKSEKALNWIQTKGVTPVYEMDSVFTGANSKALVKLKDGSQIGVDPNSLVIISLKKDQAEVNLTYGNLWSEMGPNTKLIVMAGQKKYELRSQDKAQKVLLSQERSGELKVEVNEGQVALKEANMPEKVIVPEIVAEAPIETPAPQKLEAPQFILPEEHQVLAYEFPEETEPQAAVKGVDVSWTSSSDFKLYDWQLASDPEFQNILQESQSVVTEMETTALPAGTYWMRVRGQDQAQVATDWSNPRSVILQWSIEAPKPLPAPVLTNHEISYRRNSLNLRNPASVPKEKTILWESVPEAETYKVEVSKDLQFKNPEVYTTEKTEMVILTDAPGNYYFRVFAETAKKQSPASKSGKVEVLPSEIALQEVSEIERITATPQPTEAVLNWTAVPGATSYTVEIASKPDFSDAKTVTFPENSGQIVLPKPGQYSARVQALDANNKALSEVSLPQSIQYKFRPSLTTPSLIEPFDQSSLFVQDKKAAAIWLEWKKVRGASSYEVEVSTTPDFTSVLFKQEVKGNRFLISQTMPLGKIYWRVRARSTNQDNAISDWTAHKEFTLYSQKNERFVK